MKIALVSQFYWPSVGGVQKVVQEIAERFAKEGAEVEVITSIDPNREILIHNDVKIKSFNISGNWLTGMVGEVKEYQDYVLNSPFDAIFIYAAQQWGFDALIPVIDKIKYRKIHVPCGYSGFYNKEYIEYFKSMPEVLRHFDSLVFHSKTYRDYLFAFNNQIENLCLIPNCASIEEFRTSPGLGIKTRLGINPEKKILLTIGSPPVPKGHLDVLKIFSDQYFDQNYYLVLNGNYGLSNFKSFIKELIKILLKRSSLQVLFYGWYLKIFKKKNIVFTNLPRKELISLLFESDLFIFMSHVEYSPLVLFEACAAGLPFISVPCGNAEEIASWTGGGAITAKKDILETVKSVMSDLEKLERFKKEGRESFLREYNWDAVFKKYKEVIQNGMQRH